MNMKKAKGMTTPKFFKTLNDFYSFQQIIDATKREPSHVKYWLKKYNESGQLQVEKRIDPNTNVEVEYYKMNDAPATPATPAIPEFSFVVAPVAPVAPVALINRKLPKELGDDSSSQKNAPVAPTVVIQKNASLDDNTIYVSATIPKMGLTVANMEISQFCALLDAVIKTKKG